MPYAAAAVAIFERLVSHWPSWALRTIIVLLALIVVVNVLQLIVDLLSRGRSRSSSSKSKDDKLAPPKPTKEFRMFQLQYLSVYLIIMLADWLQGT